ncbi:MAG: metallophosphoesterase [Acidimicrobiia bacterium]|nr:metallophosphoesterase [Acidimicrobiia bacterium]
MGGVTAEQALPAAEEPVHAASIVHITDTHLFVNEHGVTRSRRERTRLVRVLERLGVSDLDFATADMAERFSQALQRAVDLERAMLPATGPIVAVHTGDAEAFGSSDQRQAFSGFGHVASILAGAGLQDAVVAVYGNHDVWPGSVALFGLNGPRHDPQKRALDEAVDIVGHLPPPAPLRFPTGAGFDMVFVPLNSVNSDAVRGGLLAYGRVSHHPPSIAPVFDLVAAYELRPRDLNIAVMHHPPHFYRPLTVRDRLGVGHLEDAEFVARELAAAGIDLVLAGHRHRLDPAFGGHVDAADPTQWPLPAGVAQLVAISPTMPTDPAAARHDPADSPRSGLCVYRVMAASGSVSLHRLIHPTGPTSDPEPIFEGMTVAGLAARGITTTGPTS